MIRFLHTADWQLGMARHFFSEGVQERFSQARFDAVRTICRVAHEEKCHFVVVCGDVFDSNMADTKTIARACEALKEATIPVYLLPGNHDPLNAASIYRQPSFLYRKPENVHVVDNNKPICVSIDGEENCEIIGAPMTSKRPLQDLVKLAIDSFETKHQTTRICLGHGATDTLSPDHVNPALISVKDVETALKQGKIRYLALGDRHSLTDVGDSGAVWYSGAPEPTDYDEDQPGFAIVAEIGKDTLEVKRVKVGTWRFIRKKVHINSKEDLAGLVKWFDNLENKEITVVKTDLVGTVSLSIRSALDEEIHRQKDVFGAVEVHDSELAVITDDADFSDLHFSGFAEKAVRRLRSMADGTGQESVTAKYALALLIRISRSAE